MGHTIKAFPWLGLLAICAMSGCPSKGDDTGEPDESADESIDDDDGGEEAEKKNDEDETTTASEEANEGDAPREKIAQAKKIALEGWYVPDSPTKPPKATEWQNAEDVNVYNAKELGCEPRFVREWIRVSCRTSGDSGDPIQGVTLVKPKKSAEFFDFYKNQESYAVASVVFPIRSRTDAEIEFQWRNHSSTLTVLWEPSMERPIAHFSDPVGQNPMFCGACPAGPIYLYAPECHEGTGGKCLEGYACSKEHGWCECKQSCN